MIKSMTAFARSSAKLKGLEWSLEVRSVNHRFLEFSLKAPNWLMAYEDQIREWISTRLSRGKVYLNINVKREKGEAESFAIDELMIDFYMRSAEKIRKKHKLKDELTIHQLLSLPRVVVSSDRLEVEEKSVKSIKRLVDNVAKEVVLAREIEGKKLSEDILQRLDLIKQTLENVDEQTHHAEKESYERLKLRLQKLLKDEKIVIDQERMHKEIAILAEKSDITEEIVRLRSHLTLFLKRISSSEEIGRELDFLCQEMHREINTMGSKSQHFQISTSVIDMKKELEKIREQVQNIE